MTSQARCALGLCARWWIAVATEAPKVRSSLRRAWGGFAPGETTADPRRTALDPELPFPVGALDGRNAQTAVVPLRAGKGVK